MVGRDGLVEVAEVFDDAIICHVGVALENAGFLENGAVLRDVAFEYQALRHALERADLGRREPLDQSEVEERHATPGLEQVVAGMRITVERVKRVNPAEDEPEDRFAGQVPLVLCPTVELGEASAGRQLGGDDPRR